MNKHPVEELIKIANTLDNSGYYKEANLLTKVAYDISPDDIIMPGQQRPINNTSDDESTEIVLKNIEQQYITLINTIKSLPDTHFDEDYFGDLKREVLKALFITGLKISSLMTQAGIDNDSFEEFIEEM